MCAFGITTCGRCTFTCRFAYTFVTIWVTFLAPVVCLAPKQKGVGEFKIIYYNNFFKKSIKKGGAC